MATKYPKPVITDRRKHALGYPGRGVYSRRPLRNITTLVWHFTWSLHKQTGNIVMPKHESFWRGTHGWDIGGYAFYIDLYGNIYQNYDLEICTYGAGTANPYTLHICCEGKGDYTPAQIKAREELSLWLMGREDLPNLKVMRGHKEVPGNSTTCPGYSVAQLNQFRADLGRKLKSGATIPSQPSTPTVPEVKPTTGEHYTVKHGDNLWIVATAHGLTLNQIRELNQHRKNDMLYTGDKLRVKGDLPPIEQSESNKQPTIKKPKEYPDKGVFEFNTSVNVRNSPRLDNKPVALYNPNDSVNYDRILYGASYTWLSYVSYGGTRRYVACGDNGQLYGKFV